MSVGRPSDFTQEMADAICEKLADGESLRSICINDDMPNKATVFRWLAANSQFSDQYARAREAQADTMADEILDIADDGSNDYMGEDEKYNGDAVQRSKLRVDARKWLASKLQPKKYGEKLDVTSGGESVKLDEVATVTRLAALSSAILGRGNESSDDAG